MKKVFVTLLLGMTFLFSGSLYAGDKVYNLNGIRPYPTPIRPKAPANPPIFASIDADHHVQYNHPFCGYCDFTKWGYD